MLVLCIVSSTFYTCSFIICHIGYDKGKNNGFKQISDQIHASNLVMHFSHIFFQFRFF